MPKFQISSSKKPRKNTLNHAATDTVVQWKLCPNSKFQLLKNFEKYNIKSLNHAAADTVVQRKLCPNFIFYLLKNLEKYDLKSCSRRHCSPAEAMPKFQIPPSPNLEEKIK